jgi:NADH-quinone oxidoreductase subunit M
MMASEMASSTTPWLTLAIFVPIAFGLIVLAFGSDERAKFTRMLTLVGAVISFLVTLPIYAMFDSTTASMQFVEKSSWIPSFSVFYYLGVDGLSLWFVLLTALITIIVVLAGWEIITSRIAQYMACFLILSGLMIGVFVALDGLLFYMFFEATLIPMYIIVGVWGGHNRVYAAFKFFLYTLLGSLMTLVAHFRNCVACIELTR